MNSAVCSFSFHRLMGSGKQDIFKYILDSKKLGCSHVQPWCAHFARGVTMDDISGVGYNPGSPEAPAWLDAPGDKKYLREVRDAVRDAGLEFELIAVDRAAVHQPSEQARELARGRAVRWIDAAAELGATGIRVDSGGPALITDDDYTLIRSGYESLISYGSTMGVSVFVENHWGSSSVPENIVRFLDGISGLKYLFDTNNWAKGRQCDGWKLCAHLASSTHVKTFSFDGDGNDPSVDLSIPIRMLAGAGYSGVWGVESVPKDGDEMTAAGKTLALIRKYL